MTQILEVAASIKHYLHTTAKCPYAKVKIIPNSHTIIVEMGENHIANPRVAMVAEWLIGANCAAHFNINTGIIDVFGVNTQPGEYV